MASIGGITVDALDGEILAPADVNARTTRPGLDGERLLVLGTRPADSRVRTLQATSTPSAAIAAQQALQGDLVTVVDAAGTSHADVEVVSCRPISRAIGTSSGFSGSPTHLIETLWILRET